MHILNHILWYRLIEIVKYNIVFSIMLSISRNFFHCVNKIILKENPLNFFFLEGNFLVGRENFLT